MKKQLGQFYTTNYTYVLADIKIPKEAKKIIEPFAGTGELIKFAQTDDKNRIVEAYDIEPKLSEIKKRDTLKNPPKYSGCFVITNPPYLARNKSDDKTIFDKYGANDLFKCFLEQLIIDPPMGGILILPINFWCSIRKYDIGLRKRFLGKFGIVKMNIFETKTFEDTACAICSFSFDSKVKGSNLIKAKIFPTENYIKFRLKSSNNFMIGGGIYKLSQNRNIYVDRLTSNNMVSDSEFITNINVKCIDGGEDDRIRMYIVDPKNRYIDDTPNSSARTTATLVVSPKLDISDQVWLVEQFNRRFEARRKKYNSLFLASYRNGNRKRISFNLVYSAVNNLLNQR